MGNTTLRKIFNTLQEIKDKAKKKPVPGEVQMPMPYMCEFYNVFGYHKMAGNVLTRLINALLEGLNSRHRLPRIVIYFFDKDVLEAMCLWDDEEEIKQTLDEIMMSLAKQTKLLIKRKRYNVSEHNPGAVFGEDPKVVFIKMLRRPAHYQQGEDMERISALRPKFNDSLNMAAAEHKYYIMNLSSSSLLENFDDEGNLNDAGKIAIWLEIDSMIDQFDRNKIQLLPARNRSKDQVQPWAKTKSRKNDYYY